MSRSPALADVLLRADIWRGDAQPRLGGESVRSSFPQLDAELPDRGWPRGALTEFLLERNAGGELPLMLPALQLAAGSEGWLALISPPYLPFAPAWVAAGIDLKRLMVVRAERDDAAWCTEQILASGAFSGVMAWLPHAEAGVLRRLNLASGRHQAVSFILRSSASIKQASPAPLRVHILNDKTDAGLLGVHLVKRRGRPHAQPLYLPLINPVSRKAITPRIDYSTELREVELGRTLLRSVSLPATAKATDIQ